MLDYVHLPGVRTPGVRTGRISGDQFLSQLDHRNWPIITDELGILSVIFHSKEISKKKKKKKANKRKKKEAIPSAATLIIMLRKELQCGGGGSFG